MKTLEAEFKTIGDLQVQTTLVCMKLKIVCGIVCSAWISKPIWLWDSGENLLWDNSEIIFIYGDDD